MNNLGGSELGLGEGSNSLGRGIGSRIDFTSFTTLKRIRGLINEGQNEDAANKTITYISQMEGVRKDGMETPFYAAAYNELCLSSTNLRKVEYAMGVCNKSLELTPDHWESLKSRATLYFMTQDFPKALDDFNNSLENAPKNIAVTNVLKQNIGIVEGKIAEK